MKQIWTGVRQSKKFELTGCLLIFLSLVGGISPQSMFAFQSRVIEFSAAEEQADGKKFYTIIGGVNRPGCYVQENARLTLQHVVEMAGGLEQEAATKVRVVRSGGGGAVVCMYPSQKETEILPTEIVVVERPAIGTSRTIQYSQQLSHAEQANSLVIRNAQYQSSTPQKRDHIVLIGLKDHPVVMPLWEENITAELLLTHYLKQPESVVANTTLLAGRFSTQQPGVLQPGMVLQIPARLVQHRELPPLPPVLESAEVNRASQSAHQLKEHIPSTLPGDGPSESTPQAPTNTESVETTALPPLYQRPAVSEQAPTQQQYKVSSGEFSQQDHQTETAVLPGELQPVMTSVEKNSLPENLPQDSISIIEQKPLTLQLPTAVDPTQSMVVPQHKMNKPSQVEITSEQSAAFSDLKSTHTLRPFDQMLQATAESTGMDIAEQSLANETDRSELQVSEQFVPFVEVLDQKQTAQQKMHLAQAGEIVPRPQDLKTADSSHWIGMMAGAIVIVGVLTVITAAVQTHLFPDVDWTPAQIPVLLKRQWAELFVNHSQPIPLAHQLAKPLKPENTKPVQATSQQATPMKSTAAAVSDAATTQPTLTSPSKKTVAEMPLIIEQVRYPRELKFFGKPEQHYEFRIDASHAMPRPHIMQTRSALVDQDHLASEETTEPADFAENLESAPQDHFMPHEPNDLFSRAYAMKRTER